jgi:NTE family protein
MPARLAALPVSGPSARGRTGPMPLGAHRSAGAASVDRCCLGGVLGATGIGLGVTVFADLVLEGGGVKGIALVGAISVLQERGYEFRRVAGTLAGAIVGSLVAANAGAAELEEIMRGVDYRRFQDGPRWRSLFPGKAAALMFQQGIYEGQFVKDWLGDKLAGLGLHTFADLRYDDPERPPDQEQAYRLLVMACDISQGCLRRLPWEYGDYGVSHADQLVVDAVRASVSIPTGRPG